VSKHFVADESRRYLLQQLDSACLIVHILPDKLGNHKFNLLPGLEKGEFPIYPCRDSFSCRLDGANRPISRTQFPVVPGFSFTGYNVQGATHKRACVDLAKPSGNGVLLGRITSLSGLYVLRPFEIDVLSRRQDEDLIKEMHWLDKFSDETITKFYSNGGVTHGAKPNNKRQRKTSVDNESKSKPVEHQTDAELEVKTSTSDAATTVPPAVQTSSAACEIIVAPTINPSTPVLLTKPEIFKINGFMSI